MTIEEVVKRFDTTPFLFVGSGLSRRYLNLPDWRGLLEYFAKKVIEDEFAYNLYESKARNYECPVGVMPKIAELIQKDYDSKWFLDTDIRTVDEATKKKIRDGLSPFKAEVVEYIRRHEKCISFYEEEIRKLSEISEKSISGIITTNYDSFLEEHFQGFTKYVGQNQLIFSAIQGIGEIYKIHGSVEQPNSIVINEEDYINFEKGSPYLAAKLMTIFMEYPIIFMGYSISDVNIQKILRSIVECLDDKQLKRLEDRFVFIEYCKGMQGAEVTPFMIMIDGKPLSMKKIILEDYMLLYNVLEYKKAQLPVKLLRRFKQELYSYTISNEPTGNLRVAVLEDKRVKDEELVLAIGRISDLGLKGLSGIDSNEWYRNIIMEDMDYSADELLKYAFPKLLKENSGRLPVNKYLLLAKGTYQECEQLACKQDFNYIISNTIKNNRKCLNHYTSVKEIWENEKFSLERATRLLSHLPEEQIEISELESVLKELFEKDNNILQNASSAIRTNIRRLIMIFDYLKWGK